MASDLPASTAASIRCSVGSSACAAAATGRASSRAQARAANRGIGGIRLEAGATITRRQRTARPDLNHGAETAFAGHWAQAPPTCRKSVMRMDKLTSRFRQAIADAQWLAVGRDHNLIEPAHLLLALLDQQGGGARPLLAQAGVNVPVLRERLAEALDKLPKVTGQEGNLSVGNDLGRLL